ncbi:hypothetical protein ABFS83_08G199900 [Erythranthe nasuta]
MCRDYEKDHNNQGAAGPIIFGVICVLMLICAINGCCRRGTAAPPPAEGVNAGGTQTDTKEKDGNMEVLESGVAVAEVAVEFRGCCCGGGGDAGGCGGCGGD